LEAFLWSVWFSLLSAFHIGFREFSVGTWLNRVHPRQFTLELAGSAPCLAYNQYLAFICLRHVGADVLWQTFSVMLDEDLLTGQALP
jgi:hypothetical protein